MTRVGTGYRYTDLELLRVEYWIAHTDMTLRDMHAELQRWVPSRTLDGFEQALWRRGILVNEERRGERPWSGV